MKFAKRAVAAVVGIALAIALVQPIQAARLASALCANDADSIYEFVQHTGFIRDDVQLVVESTALMRRYGVSLCESWSVRGAYVTDEGDLAIIVVVGDDFYVFKFDAFGVLTNIS